MKRIVILLLCSTGIVVAGVQEPLKTQPTQAQSEKYAKAKECLKDGAVALAYAAGAGVSGAATLLCFSLTRDAIRLPIPDNPREDSNFFVAAGTVTSLATVGFSQMTLHCIKNSLCVVRDRARKLMGKKAEDKN